MNLIKKIKVLEEKRNIFLKNCINEMKILLMPRGSSIKKKKIKLFEVKRNNQILLYI
jgi:hypothetical protein